MIKILVGVSTALVVAIIFSVSQHYKIVRLNNVIASVSMINQACNKQIGIENEINKLSDNDVNSEFSRLFSESNNNSKWELRTNSHNSEPETLDSREEKPDKRLEAEKRMSEKLIMCEDRYYSFEQCVLGGEY